MLYAAHLAAGLIVGKVTGQYLVAILVSFLVDIDHLVTYFKHNILFDIKKIWNVITHADDPYRTQRNGLHSLLAWAIISVLALYFWPPVWIAISAAYLFHLILDLFDGSAFYPLYPIKWKLRGFVGYNSYIEYAITAILFLVWVFI